jgi:hypothetical protein
MTQRADALRSRFVSVPTALAVLALLPLLAACAGFLGAADSEFVFHESQRQYTQDIRWAQYDRAGHFLAPKALDAFHEQTADFGELRFADYQVRAVEMGADGRSATVKVTYYAYLRTSPVALAVDETQEWQKDAESRAWLVHNTTFARRQLQPGEGMF